MEDKPPSPNEPSVPTDGRSTPGTTDRLSEGGPEHGGGDTAHLVRGLPDFSTDLFAPSLPLASAAAAATTSTTTTISTTVQDSDNDNNRKRSAEDIGLEQGGATQQRLFPFARNVPQEPSQIFPFGQVAQVPGPAQASAQPILADSSASGSSLGLDLQGNNMLQLPSYSIMFGLPPVQLQQMLLEQMRHTQTTFPTSQIQPTANFGLQGFPNFLTGQQATLPSHLTGDGQILPVDASSVATPPFSTTAGFLPSTSSSASLPYIQPATMSGSAMDATSMAQNEAIGQTQTVATDDARLSGRSSLVLYLSLDEEALSPYQCLVRKNIEVFEALQADVDSNAQGRNKPITLGQVGIRCIHCSSLPPKKRARGATYYPRELKGLYQAAQNQAKGHLEKHCQYIPGPVRAELLGLKDSKSSPGSGKNYWADGVRVLGVYEDSEGLRFEKRTTTAQSPTS